MLTQEGAADPKALWQVETFLAKSNDERTLEVEFLSLSSGLRQPMVISNVLHINGYTQVIGKRSSTTCTTLQLCSLLDAKVHA